ncbi:MAG: NAD(P)H-dependent oxidoreductase [Candidatus Falkowbacteria bacterium]|nr:NAD(P)H-dependent oxidoreductase [Candidatus Falkowbacteria bacterium]
MSLYIPIVLGTARVGRKSELVANYVLSYVKKLGAETELIDVRDYIQGSTYGSNEKINSWKEIANIADALIIVTPEYNHGYPGELKILLDNIYHELSHKPLGLIGVSSGTIGGARAIEQLKLLAIEFHMIPVRTSVYFGPIASLFDDTNNIKDEAEWDKKMAGLTDELLWYAKTLQAPRQDLPKEN